MVPEPKAGEAKASRRQPKFHEKQGVLVQISERNERKKPNPEKVQSRSQ